MATSTAIPEEGGIFIEADHVQTDGVRHVSPRNHTTIASYNFNFDNKTITVPGHPRILVPEKIEERFRLTKGVVSHQAQNGQHQSETEHELHEDTSDKLSNGQALQKAVELCSPGFEHESVDFIADVKILNKLLVICERLRSSEGVARRTCFGGDVETYKFFIYDANEGQTGNNPDHHRNEGYTTPGPAIVLTRAGTVMDQEDLSRTKRKVDNRYFTQYRSLVTEREAGHPAVARNILFLVQQVQLDGLNLLVQSKVYGVERCDSASGKEGTNNVEHGPASRSSPSSPTQHQDPGVLRSGTMLGLDDTVVELLTYNAGFVREIDWRRNYWHLALVGGDKLIVGLHHKGLFNNERSTNGALKLTAREVQSRAAKQGGSLSMIYLANALREILKAAQILLPQCRPTKLDGRIRKVAIVDFPTDSRTRKHKIRVRPYTG